jgi:hypothetical protein
MEQARAEPGAAIYYQDPGRQAFYSLTPKKTPDGRDYRAVPAGADVSFDDPADVAAAPPADRKIKYYRNPMGCRTFRRRPRRTRWGWITSPSTRATTATTGSVKLSPGKIQRYRRQVGAGRDARDPHDDPRARHHPARRARVSVIAMRSESYVQKVADVTTGAHVVKGQPLMEIYSPAISSAAAEYISTLTSKVTGGGDGALRQGLAAAADESRRAGSGDRRHREGPQRPDRASNGPRRATASFSNATSRRHACPPGESLFGSPITRWYGRSSISPSAIWGRCPSASATIVRAEFSRGGSFGKGQRDLSADHQGRRDGAACASSCPIRICC